MSRLTRRFGAAIAAGALFTVAACGGGDNGGSSAGSTEVQLMMFPGVAYRLPVMIAQEKGWFDDEGISLKIIAQPNNLPGGQAMESTKSDIGQFSIATLAQAAQAGQGAKVFCGHIGEVQSSVVANVDSKLPSVQDGATVDEVLKALSGKKFGVQVPVGAGLQLITAAAIKSAGGSDVTYVNVGGSNTTTGPALDNGSVDAAIASPPGTQFLVAGGKQKVLAYLPDGGPEEFSEWYGSAWGAPTKWLDKNPKAAKGFCTAVQKGIDFVKDPKNLDESVAALVKDTKLPQEIATEVVKTQYAAYSTTLDQTQMTKTLDGYAKEGIIKPSPAVTWDNFVDDQSH